MRPSSQTLLAGAAAVVRAALRAWGDVLASAATLVLILPGCSSQSHYPSKPIVLVCPWSPGGGTDRVSRQIAAQLERELDVPVNVVNATGGGGVTGHTRGAVARPDGYTITMATVELSMLHWRELTRISYHDFEPLVLLNRDDAAIFVRDDAPWQTINELQEAIRNHPGKIKASGTARGGIWHIALAGWLIAQEMPPDAAVWISINGAGPSLQELMARGVDVVCCSVPEARSLVDGGQVRCLGVMSDTRHVLIRDVPTFREAGIDWTMGGWRGIVFPKDVPSERVGVMRDALLRVARSDELAQYMDAAGFNLTIGGPDEFGRLLLKADRQFGTIFNTAAFDQVSRSPLGPYVFPGLVMALGAVILLVLLVRGQLKLQRGTLPLSGRQALRLAWVPAAVVFFIFLADEVGFVLTAGAMLLALLLALRVRAVTAAVITVVLVPAVYHLFAAELGVPLPWGWLGW